MNPNQSLYFSKLSSMTLFKHKYIFYILTILVLALLPRLYKVNSYPPHLNWDEVSLGYNAYSILKTGKDEYVYLTTIPVKLFDLNSLSTKFVSIVSGSVSVVFIFLLLDLIFNHKPTSFVLALLYSICPWAIFLSRIALEANLFLCLFIACIYFLVVKKYSLSLIFYSLCLFTYNSSRVLLPFFIFLFAFTLIKSHVRFSSFITKHKYGLLFFLVCFVLFMAQTFNQSGQARYKWVSLLDQGAINQINQLRQVYPRILVNKVTYFLYQVISNYLSHFNPGFLFAKGGSHYQFNIPNFYLLSPFLLPFFIAGIFYFLKNRYYLPLFILLISPLPSSITRDAPHTLRSIVFLSSSTFISLVGLGSLLSRSFYKIVIVALFIGILSQISFWKKYKQYSVDYSSSWQYGYDQLTSYLKSNYSKYQHIYITKEYGEPHEFLMFYWPWPPSDYQLDTTKTWRFQSDWFWIDSFDKFTFVNDWDMPQVSIPNNSLVVTSPKNMATGNLNLLKTINYPDNSQTFLIFSN